MMNYYKCTLINKKGYVQEQFYRRSDSIASVLNELKLFQWPAGKWKIEAF